MTPEEDLLITAGSFVVSFAKAEWSLGACAANLGGGVALRMAGGEWGGTDHTRTKVADRL